MENTKLLLLANTDSATSPTGSLSVLAPNSQSPVVTQASVCADLLQPFEVLAQFVIHLISQHLRVLAVDDVALSVEEPGGDLVLSGILDDGYYALEFFGGDFSGAARMVLVEGLIS